MRDVITILSQLSDNLINNRYPNELANVLHKAIFNEEVVHEKNSFQRLSANVQIMNKNLAILCLITKAFVFYIFFTKLVHSPTPKIVQARLKAEKIKSTTFLVHSKDKVKRSYRFRLVDFQLRESLSSCSAISLDKY